MIGKLMCSVGVHRWTQVRRGDKPYQECARCGTLLPVTIGRGLNRNRAGEEFLQSGMAPDEENDD
jgi:hypothetical protein